MAHVVDYMDICREKIEELRALLSKENQRIVLLAHSNPDGDAIGSLLAWRGALEVMGHNVVCVVPNKYPYFLDWVANIKDLLIFKDDKNGVVEGLINKADIICCLDFNATSRLDALGELVDGNKTAKRVLIDHHLEPDTNFDLMFSHPESSSTCFLVYSIIEALCGVEVISKDMAEALYVGLMTDTGNFAFSHLTPALFRAVAVLVERGIDIPKINTSVYNSYTEGRARLFGYVINRKMKTIHKGVVAYMSLTEEEMKRYYFQQGDSEGFVNYPLTIKKMKISAMFVEHKQFVRVSLRSRGDIDVNQFARKYFNGGGHKNAAGGKLCMSVEEVIEYYKKSIAEYAADGGL